MKLKAVRLLLTGLVLAGSVCASFGQVANDSAGGLASGVAGALSKPPARLLTDAVFAPSSFWYTAIPRDVALNPHSANYVAEFLRQKQAYYGTVNINTDAYTSPLYIVRSGSARVIGDNYAKQVAATGREVHRTDVAEWDCQSKGFSDPGLAAQWRGVPIPAIAVPAKGTDSEMSVFDETSDTLWEFWVARKLDGSWQSCWGGRIANAAKSDGIFPLPYGATATGLPFIGGQITAEELARGEIKHAIGIALVDAQADGIRSWPALRSDGLNPAGAPNRIPEGLRFRLDPSINVDALKMHPIGKIIAKAAQKYGFVVWDKAGALSIRAENAVSYTSLGQPDPYVSLFGNTPSYAILDGFPWDKLQFLPMNYGKP
ncbi:DUF4124 domain-containing protein [Burkholderia sp. L27(2015)]|uniref:DUF4124 domain-containing protein n=1 Tax=Burkholderia sp. L27(2015) TaxID=1641858 RepID=UPI001C2083C2|nr:DUF4124 domain-containing protein [Burkholderia sp. L27(2015)]